jgi:hypothetical protein
MKPKTAAATAVVRCTLDTLLPPVRLLDAPTLAWIVNQSQWDLRPIFVQARSYVVTKVT